jgi:transcription antitermination factor NusG
MAQRWYVAVTEPRDELSCIAAMKFVGIEAFCPMARRAWQHPRTKRWKLVASPMMPGYVFCRLAPEDIGLTLDLRHVSHLLPRKGEEPRAVRPDEEVDVEALQEAEEEGSRVTLAQLLHQDKKRQERALLAKETQVRVTGGAFAGYEGKVARDDGGGKLRIIIGNLTADIPAGQVEAA